MTKKQRSLFVKMWGARAPKDVEGAVAALEALRKAGSLTAESVLEAASDPASPLHGSFEWDDTEAARLYRLIQARTVIRAVVIVAADGKGEPARAFIHVPSPDGGFYERGEVIAKNVDMGLAALSEALDDLRGAQARVAGLRHWFATGEQEDAMAIIAIAAQALSTAEAALNRLH